MISGRARLKTHALDIQSPYLVDLLKDLVKDEGVNLEVSESAYFEEPFKPLFFCYDRIVALSHSTPAGLASQHLKLLVTVLNELFKGFMHSLANLKKSRLISYQLAWTHFPHGALVYSSAKGCSTVTRVVCTNYENDQRNKCLILNCEEIAFDGEKFAWNPVVHRIPEFEGNEPVDQLPCFLLDFHPERDAVVKRLSERAKKVLEYQELSYREYDGVAIGVHACQIRKYNVSPPSCPGSEFL